MRQTWHKFSKNSKPEVLLQVLHETVNWAEHISPKDLSSTIDVRLRLLEAQDLLLKQPNMVREALLDLRRRAEHDDQCRCSVRSIIRAQAWFHVTHNELPQALTVIKTSPYMKSILEQQDDLSLDYGWMLLLNGQIQAGISMIKAAAYSKAYEPTLKDRLQGECPWPAEMLKPLDLRYALQQENQIDELKNLFKASPPIFECDASQSGNLYTSKFPWQQKREELLQHIAKTYCERPEQ